MVWFMALGCSRSEKVNKHTHLEEKRHRHPDIPVTDAGGSVALRALHRGVGRGR